MPTRNNIEKIVKKMSEEVVVPKKVFKSMNETYMSKNSAFTGLGHVYTEEGK
jgi:hypothetical protein